MESNSVAPPGADRASALAHPWDGFAIGPENELAMAAARALAVGDQERFSPLVVHGPSGVGKSRLLRGLVAERIARRPESAVAWLPADEFASLHGAPVHGESETPQARDQLRSVDLLVLDDLEGLERAPRAWEELEHTLDALDQRDAGVAVATRSAPATWRKRGWPDRVVSRLSSGLATRIDPPGPPALRRYLLEHAGRHGIALPARAVEELVSAALGYRTLDGWLARLALESRMSRRTERGRSSHRVISATPLIVLDAEVVTAFLAEEAGLTSPVAVVESIARAVAIQLDVRLADLRGPGRGARLAHARHLAIHLARAQGVSIAAIGRYFGDRDPATIRHACKAAGRRIDADPALAALAAALLGPRFRGGP